MGIEYFKISGIIKIIIEGWNAVRVNIQSSALNSMCLLNYNEGVWHEQLELNIPEEKETVSICIQKNLFLRNANKSCPLNENTVR